MKKTQEKENEKKNKEGCFQCWLVRTAKKNKAASDVFFPHLKMTAIHFSLLETAEVQRMQRKKLTTNYNDR